MRSRNQSSDFLKILKQQNQQDNKSLQIPESKIGTVDVIIHFYENNLIMTKIKVLIFRILNGRDKQNK